MHEIREKRGKGQEEGVKRGHREALHTASIHRSIKMSNHARKRRYKKGQILFFLKCSKCGN